MMYTVWFRLIGENMDFVEFDTYQQMVTWLDNYVDILEWYDWEKC